MRNKKWVAFTLVFLIIISGFSGSRRVEAGPDDGILLGEDNLVDENAVMEEELLLKDDAFQKEIISIEEDYDQSKSLFSENLKDAGINELFSEKFEMEEDLIPESVSARRSKDVTSYANLEKFDYKLAGSVDGNTHSYYDISISMDPSIEYQRGDYIKFNIAYLNHLSIQSKVYQDGLLMANLYRTEPEKINVSEKDPSYVGTSGQIKSVKVVFTENVVGRKNLKMDLSGSAYIGPRYAIEAHEKENDLLEYNYRFWLDDRPDEVVEGPVSKVKTRTIFPFVNTVIKNKKLSNGGYNAAVTFMIQNGGLKGGTMNNRDFNGEEFIVNIDNGFDLSNVKSGNVYESTRTSFFEDDHLSKIPYKINYAKQGDKSAKLEVVRVVQGYGSTPSQIVVKPITPHPVGFASKFEILAPYIGGEVDFSTKNGGIPSYTMKAQDATLFRWKDSSWDVTNLVYDSDAIFDSEKQPDNIKVNINLHKDYRLENGDIVNSDAGEFEFVLKNSSGAEIDRIITDGVNNRFKFKDLTFGPDDIGRHEYTVEEITGKDRSVDYDKNIYNVSIDVRLVGGNKLEATIFYPESGSEVSVKNTKYKDIKVPIRASKELVGPSGEKDVLKSGQFEFALYDDKGLEVSRAKSNENGDVIFEDLNFQFGDIGTHKYTIKEIVGDNKLIEYDNHVEEVNVLIKKGASGLEASVSYDAGGANFTNKRQGLSFQILKKEWGSSSKFIPGAEFEVYHSDGSPVLNEDGTKLVLVSGSDGRTQVVDNLDPGDYYCVEVKIPEGYATPPELETHFTLSEENAGETFVLEVINRKVNIPQTGGKGVLPGILLTLCLCYFSKKHKKSLLK